MLTGGHTLHTGGQLRMPTRSGQDIPETCDEYRKHAWVEAEVLFLWWCHFEKTHSSALRVHSHRAVTTKGLRWLQLIHAGT